MTTSITAAGMEHMAAAQHASNTERSTRLALSFSRSVMIVALLGGASAIVLWLIFGARFPQLLALCGIAVVVALGGASHRLLIRAGHPIAGIGAMLAIILIAMFIVPTIVPVLLPTAAASMILISLSGQALLGSGWGVWLTVACIVALVVDTVFGQSVTTSLFDAGLNQQIAESTLAVLGNIPAICAAILVVRQILTGYERALAEEHAMLRMLIDNLPDYVFIKDKDSRIIVNNVAHAKLLGNSTPDQVVGKSDFDFFPPELAQRYFDDEQRIIKSAESKFNIEEPTVDPQGNHHWLLTSKMLLHNAKGELMGIVGISRDITKLREAEQERDRLLHVEHEQRTGLETIVGQLRDTGKRLTGAAAEILTAATQQASSTAEQEATITQTMSIVEEVRMTVRQSAERAQGVADASKQSVSVARTGQQSVNDTIEAMRVIQKRVESIAQTILMLSQRTQQIGEIIASVNDISEQSKLLALNASIEAARAGDEGKGFGVVAMEVRQLADQSRDATARVRNILSEIQQATNAAVMVTEEGNKGAEAGLALVERAGQAIQDLAMTIEDATNAAIQIAASTQQQTTGMDQLVVSMSQIRSAASITTTNVRQTEHSMQDLMSLARQLEQTAERFSF